MEAKGYLKRVQCEEDKRKRKLLLTNTGISLTQEIISCAREVNNELIKNLDEDEGMQLLNLLQKMQITINDK